MAIDRKYRIVFLCSGGGGNLSLVYTAIRRLWIPSFEIVGVLTDRHCAANQFAERFGIDNEVLHIDKSEQNSLLSHLERLNPDLVITTIHKILHPTVVKYFRNRLINLHYSLLPSFSGSIGNRPIKGAIKYGSLIGGVTVHSVNEEVDAGTPLVQASIPLHKNDSLDDLMPIFFRCGGIALLKAVTQIFLSDLKNESACRKVLGRNCLFSGEGLDLMGIERDEAFWLDVKTSLQF